MPKLYHVRATIDYMAWAPSSLAAEGELSEALFDADAIEMTVETKEFKLGDKLPKNWLLESVVYGDEDRTVSDCLARIAFNKNQIGLPLGAHEEESE